MASWIGMGAVLAVPASAQIRTGAIAGVLSDPSGARVAGQRVEIHDAATGQVRRADTDHEGRFSVGPLPYGAYRLAVPARPGFLPFATTVVVASNLPVHVRIVLAIAHVDARQVVTGASSDRPGLTTRSEVRLNGELAVLPAQRASSMAALMSAAPGVARAHNGLVHVRGVEDGMLYVVDGIPITERHDALHASAFDLDAIDSVTLVTGNLPAEFGGRSGAVASIDHTPGERPFGYAAAGLGTAASRDGVLGLGIAAGRVHVSASAVVSASDRFLDPVDEGNFQNHGERAGAGLRAAWAPSGSRLTASAAAAGTRLDVPNDAVQHAAGQRQIQRLDDRNVSLSWQRVASERTVTDAAVFHRRYASRLAPGEFDTPISARARRSHTRSGVVSSLTHQRGRHLFKAGVDVSRVAPREDFRFAVTDPVLAAERDVSEPALAFTPDRPFTFADRRVGSYAAVFVQDEIALGARARLDAGLRVERASLPQAAAAWSPRLGAAIDLPRLGGVARVSFNRLFMPPHVEYLLLASSEAARALSPFARDGQDGGATVRPERVTSVEAGYARTMGTLALDVAWWDRRFADVADPNVFFNTTIVFPNSVAAGRARGVDVRLTLRERRGVSGFLNYTHARVTNTGPITGGLFLTDEFAEIGPGTVFAPDHDQPHVAAAGLRLRPASRWWVALDARHGGGGPLEVDDDDLSEVVSGPGGDLVDAARGRMRPWTLVDVGTSVELLRGRRGRLSLRADVHNAIGSRFAYTVGNPFEGTRFGHPRMVRVGVRWQSPPD